MTNNNYNKRIVATAVLAFVLVITFFAILHFGFGVDAFVAGIIGTALGTFLSAPIASAWVQLKKR